MSDQRFVNPFAVGVKETADGVVGAHLKRLDKASGKLAGKKQVDAGDVVALGNDYMAVAAVAGTFGASPETMAQIGRELTDGTFDLRHRLILELLNKKGLPKNGDIAALMDPRLLGSLMTSFEDAYQGAGSRNLEGNVDSTRALPSHKKGVARKGSSRSDKGVMKLVPYIPSDLIEADYQGRTLKELEDAFKGNISAKIQKIRGFYPGSMQIIHKEGSHPKVLCFYDCRGVSYLFIPSRHDPTDGKTGPLVYTEEILLDYIAAVLFAEGVKKDLIGKHKEGLVAKFRDIPDALEGSKYKAPKVVKGFPSAARSYFKMD